MRRQSESGMRGRWTELPYCVLLIGFLVPGSAWGEVPDVVSPLPTTTATAPTFAHAEMARKAALVAAFSPTRIHLQSAALEYLRLGDLQSAGQFAARASKAQASGDSEEARVFEELKSEFLQSSPGVLAQIRSSCPPTLTPQVLKNLEVIDPGTGHDLAAAVARQASCFRAAFPELPGPVLVTQDGIKAGSPQPGVFIVFPGQAEVTSAGHPPLAIDLIPSPGLPVSEFRPRDADWLKGRLLFKGLPEKARVVLDGGEVLPGEGGLVLEPMDLHQIQIEASGRSTVVLKDVALSVAESRVVEVRANKKRSVGPWILIGVGLASLGTGAGVTWNGLDMNRNLVGSFRRDDQGLVTNWGHDDALARQSEARRWYYGGVASMSLGAAITLAGIVWACLDDTTPPEWRRP